MSGLFTTRSDLRVIEDENEDAAVRAKGAASGRPGFSERIGRCDMLARDDEARA